MGKIAVGDAVSKAMALANRNLATKIDGKSLPYNCGSDSDFVFNTDEAALKNQWEKKSFKHGTKTYVGKMIASSGEAKFDLRLVAGTEKAAFNYHVPFKQDTRAADKAKAQSTADKKMVAAGKKTAADEAAKKTTPTALAAAKKATDDAAAAAKAKERRDQALATAWNGLKTKPKDKAAWTKDWLEKNKNRKF